MSQFPELARLAEAGATLSAAEFAAIAGMAEEVVRDGIRTGELPGRKVGGRFYVPRLAAYRYLQGDWPRQRRVRRVVVERVERRIDAHRYLRAYRR